MNSASFDSTENQDWTINLDLGIVSDHLANNPDFIKAIAIEVRNQLTKDVRRMGNLYGSQAQKTLNNQTSQPSLNTGQTRRVV